MRVTCQIHNQLVVYSFIFAQCMLSVFFIMHDAYQKSHYAICVMHNTHVQLNGSATFFVALCKFNIYLLMCNASQKLHFASRVMHDANVQLRFFYVKRFQYFCNHA